MEKGKLNIDDLLGRPLWQMTGKECYDLIRYAIGNGVNLERVARRKVIGIPALAKELSCSPSQLYEVQRNGKLKEAICSRIGRTPTYEVEKARLIAENYMAEKRAKRSKTKIAQ